MPLLIGFDLLDRQIVDRDGVPVGKVDDVEFSDDGRSVTALLTGQRALGARFGGRLGRWITDTATRLDIVCEVDADGRPELVAVLAVRGPWGRLLGYEREQVVGPWIVEKLARWVLRRRMTTVPWRSLRWES
jgi:hypothetical protein